MWRQSLRRDLKTMSMSMTIAGKGQRHQHAEQLSSKKRVRERQRKSVSGGYCKKEKDTFDKAIIN